MNSLQFNNFTNIMNPGSSQVDDGNASVKSETSSSITVTLTKKRLNTFLSHSLTLKKRNSDDDNASLSGDSGPVIVKLFQHALLVENVEIETFSVPNNYNTSLCFSLINEKMNQNLHPNTNRELRSTLSIIAEIAGMTYFRPFWGAAIVTVNNKRKILNANTVSYRNANLQTVETGFARSQPPKESSIEGFYRWIMNSMRIGKNHTFLICSQEMNS